MIQVTSIGKGGSLQPILINADSISIAFKDVEDGETKIGIGNNFYRIQENLDTLLKKIDKGSVLQSVKKLADDEGDP